MSTYEVMMIFIGFMNCLLIVLVAFIGSKNNATAVFFMGGLLFCIKSIRHRV